MVFDRTCTRHGRLPVGLSHAWRAGGALYRGIDRLDAAFGVTSWAEAFRWLARFEGERPIAEVQYWGHGRWGRVLVAREALETASLREGHAHRAGIDALRERLTPDARVWFRTCEAFGARLGGDFARAITDVLGVPVAGHTFIIGALQSGLRALAPGCRPTWSALEGLAEGTADAPVRAHVSGLLRPRTITCLANEVPAAWLAEDSGALS